MADTNPAAVHLQRLARFGTKPGLERIRFLLDRLGNPQQGLPVILIAGTNGKGSTAALLAAILRAAGLQTGLYTSPHLMRYNERIVVDGVPVDDRVLLHLWDRVAPAVEAAAAEADLGQPTEFEAGTAMALLHFAQAGVDAAVVEVGMGGRWDATNVLQPVVAVITPIGYDHTRYLGRRLGDIAAEKAAIIKPGVRRGVMAPQRPAAATVIRRTARREGVPLVQVGRNVTWTIHTSNHQGSLLDVASPGRALSQLRIGLLGRHQGVNAATAVAAAWSLMDEGWTLPEPAIRAGLGAARWPGRMEVVDRDPVVLLDGAHNTEGARYLAESLAEIYPDQRPVVVFGTLAEKPVGAMLDCLLPRAAAMVFTQPQAPRTTAADPHALARRAAAARVPGQVIPDPRAALAAARRLAGRDGLVCVCGSLYLVGDVRGAWPLDRLG